MVSDDDVNTLGMSAGLALAALGIVAVIWPDARASIFVGVFLLGAGVPFVLVGFDRWLRVDHWHWIKLEEYRSRLFAADDVPVPTITPNTELQPVDDDHYRARWRQALITFLFHARARGSLLSADHVGVTVGEPKDWVRLTDVLAAHSLIDKRNGHPTRMALRWTYTSAIRALQDGYLLDPPEEPPPRVLPFPGTRVELVEQGA